MEKSTSILSNLIDVNDCVLIVIDVQDSFLTKYSRDESEKLVSRVGWLMDAANALQVPLVVTAEDIARDGSMTASLTDRLPPNTPIYNKMFFNLADNPEIMLAVHATNRRTAVLVGLETDVCIAQTALGLLQNGYQVAVVADATDSPGEAHAVGLERMRHAGVLVTSLKALYYEWVRGVEKTHAVWKDELHKAAMPIGITF